jgi:UDP-3-O-[3-hydroxymyristoyl] glucosamine N-acyltransferase
MEFTAKMIADFLKGKIEGNPDAKVSNVSKIEEGNPGTISFLANPKYEKYIYTTNASIVIVNDDFKPEKPLNTTLIRVPNAYQALAALLELQEKMKPQKKGIDSLAFVHPSAKIGENAFIGAFAVISENATIGNNVKIYPQVYIGDNSSVKDNTTIYPGVKIYHDCHIGADCVIHAGVVIGSDGFGFAPQEGSDYKKVPQVGNVIIEDHVEIGANTAIDRATLGSTIIRKGVKLDNLIQIAHNVEVGENTVMAGQSGIAGSTKIGKNVMVGGQVGIIGHITVADKVKIAAQSGITLPIKTEGEIVQGSPSFGFSRYQRSYVLFRKLPDLYEKIQNLEKQVKELKEKL